MKEFFKKLWEQIKIKAVKINEFYEKIKENIIQWCKIYVLNSTKLTSRLNVVFIIQKKIAVTLIWIMGIVVVIFLLKLSLIIIFFLICNLLYFIYDIIKR
jgi:hypothetical protein